MPLTTGKAVTTLAAVTFAGVLAAAGFVWSGAYDVGADEPHWRSTHAVLQTLRQRSINARASRLEVPSDLGNPERIRQGAGNYAAMCAGCHLSPGVGETEMSKGLYPAPPDLTKQAVEVGRAFWVIKHGIKASGMPAWGKSMEDGYIWNMAAFIQELPKLDAAGYKALVDSSGGHSHGGGETTPHGHADAKSPPSAHDKGAAPDHGEKDGNASSGGEATSRPHAHPPGTPPHHDEPAAPPKQEPDATPVPASAEAEPHDEHHQHQPY